MPWALSPTYRRTMASTDERTFLVESYVPGLDEARAAELTLRLRSAIAELRREGLTLRWLRSFALVDEETYAWMISAADADQVATVQERAAIRFDHVAEVAAGDSVGS
jgi:hypothetical protein